ncbi:MAG: c-type cytochrome [Flavisolibacter sp.]
MKRTFVILASAFLLYACGNNENAANKTNEPVQQPAADAQDDPRLQHGLEMIAKNDCLGCHKVAEQLTGPAYMDVANRYRDSTGIEDSLAARIIRGSSGHWGPAQMTPHPNLAPDSARIMVEYILSLKE